MIAIVDYGSGNVAAIMNILRQRKIPHVLTNDPGQLRGADRYILPGVGAFDPTMTHLIESGMVDLLTEEVLGKGKKVLGVCVGMHLLSEGSEEGELPGLGWIKGRVRRIDAALLNKPRLPHMGWNSIVLAPGARLFDGVDTERGFYFLHTYYFDASDQADVSARVSYGVDLPCSVQRNSVFGDAIPSREESQQRDPPVYELCEPCLMLQSRIIPSLLMRDGGLVKTRRFGDEKYVGDPINAVKIFNEKEVDELAIFDIGATVQRREPDYDHLRSIAVESRMPLCYGGGVTRAAQGTKLIGLGFEKVSVSSAAVERPELIREMADAVGVQSVVVTIDVRKTRLYGRDAIFTHNGRTVAKRKLLDFVQEAEVLGAGEIIINAIDHDGMMQGYDLDLAKTVRGVTTVPLTILGGAGTVGHMSDLITAIGTCGAAAGSLFVFNGVYRAVLISYARP